MAIFLPKQPIFKNLVEYFQFLATNFFIFDEIIQIYVSCITSLQPRTFDCEKKIPCRWFSIKR